MAVKKKKESLNDYIEATLEKKMKKYLERKIDAHILTTHSKQINASRKMIDARHKKELAKKFEDKLSEKIEITATPQNGEGHKFSAGHSNFDKHVVNQHLGNLFTHIKKNKLGPYNVSIHDKDTGEVHHAKVSKEAGVYKKTFESNEALIEAFVRRTKEQWSKANERTKKWKERSPKDEVPDSWKKKDEPPKKEVKEEINELSKATLGSYVKKAKKSALDSAFNAGLQSKKPTSVGYITSLDLAKKRSKGITKAVNRLAGDDVEDHIKALVRKKFVTEEAPTNSMGASSSTAGTGPIDTIDPILGKKVARRKKIKPEGL